MSKYNCFTEQDDSTAQVASHWRTAWGGNDSLPTSHDSPSVSEGPHSFVTVETWISESSSHCWWNICAFSIFWSTSAAVEFQGVQQSTWPVPRLFALPALIFTLSSRMSSVSCFYRRLRIWVLLVRVEHVCGEKFKRQRFGRNDFDFVFQAPHLVK